MVKDDSEFGKWIATMIINGFTIKRYSRGFTFKNKGESFRHSFPEGTTSKQMSDYAGQVILNGEIARL